MKCFILRQIRARIEKCRMCEYSSPHMNCARIKAISSEENCCCSDINHHAAPRWFVRVWWNVQSHKYASDS